MRHHLYLEVVTSARESRHSAEAMHQEISVLEDNATWVMEPFPPRRKDFGCKWVHKFKYHLDGHVECLKARLVIFG